MLQANDYKVIDCGSKVRRMYEFNGRTPRGERVVVEGSPDVRTVTAPCPRCSGSGTVAREIDAAYSVRRKND